MPAAFLQSPCQRVKASVRAQVGEEYVLTIRDPSSVGAMAIGVSYDAFVDDVVVSGC